MTIYNFEHTPIYEIGDKVFEVSTTSTQKTHKCPDCLETKKWETTSPAGIEYSFPCPRCQQTTTLTYYEYTHSIIERTIGSIRIDTANKKNPIEYMCIETGVGSGSIYIEKRLHKNKACAKLYGEQLVKRAEENDTQRMKNTLETLVLSRYNLHLTPKKEI
jgi:CRISPR/Cas system-associated protein Cas7 (RAMP superfamily)